MQEEEEQVQEGLQKQLQVVLRYHYHYMKSRAGGAAEESVVLVRVIETESMARLSA